MVRIVKTTNKYLVLVTVCLGTILTGYVGSSINIALPNIMQTFGFTMDSVVWVSLSYMIPYGSTLPIMGKLGDQFGRKKMYLTGMALFTIATMLVGMSWNDVSLIVFRIFQGIGAGLLFPNAMALVSSAFPASERGQALGMWGAIAAAGGALGPTVGGYIIEYVNWRIIFYTIVPVSALGLVMSVLFLAENRVEQDSKIDYLGGILLVAGLSALLMALNQGAKEGWTSLYIVSLLAMAVFCMAGFIYAEKSVRYPLVDLTLFENSTFTMSNLVGFLSFMALYGGMFLLPFFLRNILGYSAVRAGMAMLPMAGAMVLLAPLGGRLADRAGSRIPAALGMMILAAALFMFHSMDERVSAAAISVRLIIMGMGLAFTMSPLSNGAIGTLPKEKIGVGSGVFNLFKNVGGSVGVAVMGTLLPNRQLFHSAALTEYVASGSDTALRTLNAFQAGFMQSGMPAGQANTAALSMLQGLVSQQAAVAAFGDVFLVTAVLCAVGVAFALLITDSSRPVSASEEEQPGLAENMAEPAVENL